MTQIHIEIVEKYQEFLQQLAEKIQLSQVKSVIAINCELIQLYWEVGTSIIRYEESSRSIPLDNLAREIECEFPAIKAFTGTNMNYMVQFAKEYSEKQIIQQLLGHIPWGHNILLFKKFKNKEERFWYASKTICNGWSQKRLVHWIDKKLYQNKGRELITSQNPCLSLESDLAQQLFEDLHCFGFLAFTKKFDKEKLKNGSLQHIEKFLLGLGSGFALVGRQVEFRDPWFWLDLLFYHVKLRCFIVVELEVENFDPKHIRYMNSHLTSVDERMKHKDDNLAIGLLICKTNNKLVVKYAFRDFKEPLKGAKRETNIVNSLPDNLKGLLPTIAEIEHELDKNEYIYL